MSKKDLLTKKEALLDKIKPGELITDALLTDIINFADSREAIAGVDNKVEDVKRVVDGMQVENLLPREGFVEVSFGLENPHLRSSGTYSFVEGTEYTLTMFFDAPIKDIFVRMTESKTYTAIIGEGASTDKPICKLASFFVDIDSTRIDITFIAEATRKNTVEAISASFRTQSRSKALSFALTHGPVPLSYYKPKPNKYGDVKTVNYLEPDITGNVNIKSEITEIGGVFIDKSVNPNFDGSVDLGLWHVFYDFVEENGYINIIDATMCPPSQGGDGVFPVMFFYRGDMWFDLTATMDRLIESKATYVMKQGNPIPISKLFALLPDA